MNRYCALCGGYHDDASTGGCLTTPRVPVLAIAPAICPLCQGSGIREKVGKEHAPLPMSTETSTTCHGCAGLGWIR